jgi:hypothetical protein
MLPTYNSVFESLAILICQFGPSRQACCSYHTKDNFRREIVFFH